MDGALLSPALCELQTPGQVHPSIPTVSAFLCAAANAVAKTIEERRAVSATMSQNCTCCSRATSQRPFHLGQSLAQGCLGFLSPWTLCLTSQLDLAELEVARYAWWYPVWVPFCSPGSLPLPLPSPWKHISRGSWIRPARNGKQPSAHGGAG